jgi:hypothetical protein
MASHASSPDSVRQVGIWSAAVTAIASLAFDVAVLFPDLTAPRVQIGPLLPSLVLAPAFLALLVSIDFSVPQEKKIWSRLATMFGAAYVPLVTAAYIVELFVVEPMVLSGQADRVALLTVDRTDSVLNAIDGLGYVFMSGASLCVAAAIDGGRLERAIRRLFLVTGVLAVPIVLTYFVDRRFMYVAGLWGVTVPASAILLGIFFYRRSGSPVVPGIAVSGAVHG